MRVDDPTPAAPSDFRWEDPPEPLPRRRTGRSTNLEPSRHLQLLKRNPRRWARLRIYANDRTAARSIDTLSFQYAPEGFEFVRRRDVVYGRWIGKGST